MTWIFEKTHSRMPKLIHSSCSGVLFIKERGIPGYDLSVGPGRSGPGGYYTGVRLSLIKELNFSGAKTPKVFYTHATKTILKHYGLAEPTLLQRYIVSLKHFWKLFSFQPQSESFSMNFKGSSDPRHFIFEINVGKKRIRHRTTLNLNDNRFWIDLEVHRSISASLCVGSDSFRHWFHK